MTTSSSNSSDSVESPNLPASRILVVDDEANIRRSLERLLRRQKYEVIQAESVAEAKNALMDQPIDLLLSDLRMPGEDGIELLGYAFREHPHVGRILLTGHADLEQTMRAINEGCSGQILTKPWNDKHLLQVVAEQLQRSQLLKRNEQLLRINQLQNAQLKSMNERLEKRVNERTAQLKASANTLQKSNKSLLLSYRSTVRLLLELSSLNPGIDSELAQQMSEVGVTLAKRMDLKPADISAVRYACQLHELGKLGLPQELATAREALLSTREWETYRQYPEYGATALTSVDYLASVSVLIASHREHWDGSGFPKELSGDDLPLGSQVVLLSRDYVTALRKAQSRKETLGRRGESMNVQMLALEEVEQWRDQRYSGSLVDVLKQTLAIEEVEVEEEAPSRGHLVSARTLEPGMILAQDVYTNQDLLMLTKGQKLSPRHIEKLLAMENEYGRDLSIYIDH